MNLSRIFAVMGLTCAPLIAQPAPHGPHSAPGPHGNAVPIGVGVHAAFDYSFLYGLAEDWNMGDDEDAPSGIGFEVGVQARFDIMHVLQFTPELNFRYTKLNQEDESCERNFRQMDLEVPLLVRGNVMNRFYIMAGPQLGISLSDKVSLDGDDANIGGGLGKISYSIEEDIEQKTFGFGVALGIGWYVYDKINIDFRMYLGLADMYDDGESILVDLDGAKQMTFKFGIGYWFI